MQAKRKEIHRVPYAHNTCDRQLHCIVVNTDAVILPLLVVYFHLPEESLAGTNALAPGVAIAAAKSAARAREHREWIIVYFNL